MSTWYDAHLVLIQATFVSLLLALSIQVPLRMGVFSFAGVGFYGIGAYTSAIMIIEHGWSAPEAIALGMVFAAVGGFVLSLVVQRLDGIYLGMATIAFDLILSVIVVNAGTTTGGPQGLFGALADLSMLDIVIAVVVVLAIIAWTERGKIGRRIEALREDPALAISMGIKVGRMRRMSFVASGLLGGLAGGVNVVVRTTVTPDDIGFPLVVLALTMIIVGGRRSWLGAVIGAVIFTWLPSFLSFVGTWQNIIYGAIVALAAVWIPGGLVGSATDIFRAVQARRRRAAAPAADSTAAPETGIEASAMAALESLSEQPTAGSTA
jgi:branched-chain amino acid transport system permease protein